mmetsp:Transcript_7100/g.20076  ORF Transcript_7100/g.20076 Transcript_7100/m.20076 type:complete len:108 (+) Transcript_7100:108-431(+)
MHSSGRASSGTTDGHEGDFFNFFDDHGFDLQKYAEPYGHHDEHHSFCRCRRRSANGHVENLIDDTFGDGEPWDNFDERLLVDCNGDALLRRPRRVLLRRRRLQRPPR